jgi:hypothetical protein
MSLLPVAVVALILPLVAQTTVTVTGVVDDESGAPIPGATVTLLRQTTPVLPSVPSKADGGFVFEGIAPGAYTLKVELSGFQTYQRPLSVDDGVRPLRVTLRIAAVEQEVTVESDTGDVLSTATSETATMKIDDEWVRDLPVAADNLLATIANFLAPAAQGAAGPAIVVDGVESDGLDLPSSAISKIRVNRSPYSAVYQHPGKSRVEVSTKHGHRSGYEGGLTVWDNNSMFAARNAFATSVPDLNRRLMQGTLGGALLGKKSSFYVSGERFVNDESVVINAMTLGGPFVQNVPTSQHHDTLFARIQWSLNSLQHLYATYAYGRQSFVNRESGGFNLPERGISVDRAKHKLTISHGAILPPSWQNNLLFTATSEDERAGAAASVPGIIVTRAFAAGPSQTFTGGTRRTVDLENTSTYLGRAHHALVLGGKVHVDSTNAFDASNFGGMFEFASLSAFAAGAPLFFRANRGNPNAAFDIATASAFAQDEMRVTPQLTLTAGLRYDWQSTLHDANNVGPRVSVLFAPDTRKKTLVRGGAGIFHDNLPRSATERSQLFDGVRLREMVIVHPAFPDAMSAGQATSTLPSAIRLAPNLQSPSLAQASAGIEHELWRKNWLAVEYIWLRGTNLFRARNVNAPLPGTAARPDPAFLNITQVESTAFQRSNALTISWRGRIARVFDPYVQYVFSKTTNNTSGVFVLPANNYDLAPETGPADFDARHRLNLIGVMRLPRGFQSGVVLAMSSGVPFDITTGFDDNGDTVANDRPHGVTRNTGRGPGIVQLDMRFAKSFDLARTSDGTSDVKAPRRRDTFDVGLDVFNVLNRTNITNVVGVMSSPFFGRGNAAAPARTLQFSARYSFRR